LTLAEGNVTLRNEVSGILGSIFDPKPNLTIADLASNAEITVIFNNFTASFEFETSIQLGETFNYHILGPAGVGFPGFSVQIPTPSNCFNLLIPKSLDPGSVLHRPEL